MAHKIEVIKGDITKIQADVIVNAANSSLMGGGGVDGAIHRAGGPEILEECKKIIESQAECKTGEAVITSGGKLPARYVIHTVGPIWHGGQHGERKQLANCYKNSLRLAIEYNCKTIAFPNISTGVYSYPKAEAAEIAVNTVVQVLDRESSIEKVFFVCFDEENYQLVKKRVQLLTGAKD